MTASSFVPLWLFLSTTSISSHLSYLNSMLFGAVAIKHVDVNLDRTHDPMLAALTGDKASADSGSVAKRLSECAAEQQ